MGWIFIQDRAAPIVGGFAGGELLELAEKAIATGNHERNHHTVAALHGGDGRAGFFDDAHELMAEDIAVLHGRDLAPVQVQVRATDRGGGDPQNDVVGLFNDRIGHGIHLHLVCALVSHRSHALRSCR